MIHYTLLPEPEIRKLRWEYRIRFVVILILFISGAIIVGMLSLIPSYVLSGNQGVLAEKSVDELQKSRQARGIDQVEKELSKSALFVKQVKSDQAKVIFSELVQEVARQRSPQILLSSFEMSSVMNEGTTTVSIIIQGKALTREALLEFKKTLEADKKFVSVELPISDLAKSKDILFALRLTSLF